MNLNSSIYKQGLLVIGLYFTTLLTFAQVEFSKNESKSFSVAPSVTLDMFNKYGKIHLATWDKDSIRVEMKMRAHAKNESKLAKITEDVSFVMEGNEHFVTIKTVIGPSRNKITNEISDAMESIFAGSNELTIEYKVYIPPTANVKLVNKFGDIYCDEIKGDVRIKLSHGDIKATSFLKDAQVDLKFGNGQINYVKSGRFTIQYGDFTIKKAGKISVKSSSSTINIGEVDNLKIASRNDKFHLKKVGRLAGESSFSDFNIDVLSSYANITTKYGSLTIYAIPETVSTLMLTSNYTDINFSFDQNTSYHLNLTHKKVELTYPVSIAKLQTNSSDDDKTLVTTGTIGKYSDPQTSVVITAEGSDVFLGHK